MKEQDEIASVTEKVEALVNKALVHMSDGNDGYNLDRAMLVGVTTDGAEVLNVNAEIASHGDIYQLLDDKNNVKAVKGYNAIALVTCGWAAPIQESQDEPEVAPSQSPNRRRVRLVVCANRNALASVLRFQDDAETPILDSGEAHGPLAEAVMEFVRRAI
jgi:hypothetical protein